MASGCRLCCRCAHGTSVSTKSPLVSVDLAAEMNGASSANCAEVRNLQETAFVLPSSVSDPAMREDH